MAARPEARHAEGRIETHSCMLPVWNVTVTFRSTSRRRVYRNVMHVVSPLPSLPAVQKRITPKGDI
ncbi:hypothetical protein BCF44_106497 [Kutzneria buriramensis]|uniref:Uncharacterized protein n=1 Tax=Kutzneria buriramensis TaxID=1045776 RepID=A0A3E0HLH0_9PSEU|nr:hypothetical protein BCF44_106497 [Kutzneria buriramensis]